MVGERVGAVDHVAVDRESSRRAGGGSSPHAWGIANANKVLLDSLVAQAADGTLIVGRGVPDAWLTAGETISVTNFPTTDGHRLSVRISGGDRSVTLTVNGIDRARCSSSSRRSSTTSRRRARETIDEATGTVRLSANEQSVTVQLRH